MGRLLSIGRERADRRSEVLLEEEVVLVRDTTNASEDRALHEVVGVGAKALFALACFRVEEKGIMKVPSIIS